MTATSYLGKPTPRIDGRAKVTGLAKYAAEYNVSGLAHGCVVSSAIAKGRIKRIHTADALSVDGVLDVFTHEHRPKLASSHEKYTDEVAPSGSPFRPLYDDKILFSGQPVALVVAEEFEIARFAASLIRVEYEEETHVTDLYRQRPKAVASAKPGADMFAPPKRRGAAKRAFAAAEVRHEGEYHVPIEHHNPMEPYASTVMWDGGGKLTVYDKTQGVQNVQRYLCGIFNMKSGDVRVVSPFVGG